MGLNARVGFVPYKGWSMDDAVVISQSFADKLRSNHMYQYEEDDETASATGKNYFNSVYPGKYSKEQLDKIDDNGVVKVGSIVKGSGARFITISLFVLISFFETFEHDIIESISKLKVIIFFIIYFPFKVLKLKFFYKKHTYYFY